MSQRSLYREIMIEVSFEARSSIRGKGLVVETKSSASPRTDSRLIVKESRNASPELEGRSW